MSIDIELNVNACRRRTPGECDVLYAAGKYTVTIQATGVQGAVSVPSQVIDFGKVRVLNVKDSTIDIFLKTRPLHQLPLHRPGQVSDSTAAILHSIGWW